MFFMHKNFLIYFQRILGWHKQFLFYSSIGGLNTLIFFCHPVIFSKSNYFSFLYFSVHLLFKFRLLWFRYFFNYFFNFYMFRFINIINFIDYYAHFLRVHLHSRFFFFFLLIMCFHHFDSLLINFHNYIRILEEIFFLQWTLYHQVNYFIQHPNHRN